jgi:hypothetical protein
MKSILSLAVVCSLSAVFTSPAAEASKIAALSGPAQNLRAEQKSDRVVVSVAGQPFTEYLFTADEKYPYFFPVIGPRSAESVTARRLTNFPHHSSVFFGCDRVNGGNFWQEGLERGRIIAESTKLISSEGTRVVIEQDCSWERPGAESPFTDHRVITITAPSPDLRFIDFHVTLKPRIKVKIEKTNHSLFSVRAAPDLTPSGSGELVNANGERGEKGTFGKKAAWATFRGQRKGQTEGVAIFDSPQNRWSPSPWFTRDYGFMSPTPMYWPEKNSIELAPSEDVRLRYRVVIYGGTLDEAQLKAIFEQWAKDGQAP